MLKSESDKGDEAAWMGSTAKHYPRESAEASELDLGMPKHRAPVKAVFIWGTKNPRARGKPFDVGLG
jgi:hypothetical protein